MPSDTKLIDAAIGEATGLFRTIRKLKIGQADNFEIRQSDSMVKMLLENIKYVTLAATIIGLITLIGASIGLMNIMLVSVSERTREIGVRKAIGTTNLAIRNQFLIESIVIGQIGGFWAFSWSLFGNIISVLFESSFIIPWMWILLGFYFNLCCWYCFRLIACKQSCKLNPIDSLRYE